MNIPSTLDEDRFRRAIALLARAGLGALLRWTPLAGGANNQVFRVESPERVVLLKAYFVHPDDPRDRLSADYGFARFACGRGVTALPRPLTSDEAGGLALFEYVPGRKLWPGEVTRQRVREALDFFLAVNARRDETEARALPTASEACFTLKDHLDCVRRRVERLQSIEGSSCVDRAAQALARGELTVLAAAVLSRASGRAAALGLDSEEPTATEDRCLSPSDFGFHNALLAADGRLKFFDFEYGGWDDPAKTAADFFCQPERPAPIRFFEEFAAAAARLTSNPELHLRRFRLLLPVYRLKWCCILLNDFLPAGGRRRRFAGNDADEEGRKTRQLLKAQTSLRKLGLYTGRSAREFEESRL